MSCGPLTKKGCVIRSRDSVQIRDGDGSDALGLDKASYRRRRAVLLTARALALADRDRDLSRDLAREAVKLAPSLVPAAALAGRQLAEAGERRKATRILDTAWRASKSTPRLRLRGARRMTPHRLQLQPRRCCGCGSPMP